VAEARRCVVLGLGNTLNRDEGLGVHLLPLLQKRIGSRTTAEFLDGGTLGLNLLPLVEECLHLLILDAVDAGKQKATVVELARDEIPLYSGVRLSQHQVTFQEVLGLAHMRGRLPAHLHLVGIQPADLSVGYGLSEEIQRVVPVALQRAEDVLRSWGLIMKNLEAEHVSGRSR
jgi:hydrogenase maturation protease